MKTLVILIVIFSFFIKSVTPFPQAEDVYAVSLGGAPVGLYGKTNNLKGGSNTYAASLGGTRVGLFDRFGVARPINLHTIGNRFQGVIYPEVQPTVYGPKLPNAYPSYLPYQVRYGIPPRIINKPGLPMQRYERPQYSPIQQTVRVEAYAAASVQSPQGPISSIARSYAEGTRVGSQAISVQGQSLPINTR